VRGYLERCPERVVELWVLSAGGERQRTLLELAQASGVRVIEVVDEARLGAVCGEERHQGVVALLGEYRYESLAELLARKSPVLMAADGLEDPRNLGALVRSAAAAGVGGLVIPKDRSASVTPVAERAAAGVTAWFPVCRVTNLSRALVQARNSGGYWIVGLDPAGDADLWSASVPKPCVLVIGGECGLRRLTRETCDLVLRIPMAGGVESLNAAVAGAVAAFEILSCRRGR